MKRRSVCFVFVLMSIASACARPAPGEPVWVVLPPGASINEMGDSLAANDIIRSSRALRWYAKMAGKRDSLKGGVYEFMPNTPLALVVEELVKGRPPMTRVVIPAGANMFEIAGMVERELGMPFDEVLAAAEDSGLVAMVGARGQTVEGYLYPGTYWVETEGSAVEVLATFIAAFEKRWNPVWDQRADSLGFTRDEVVTLASIIEGEVRDSTDRTWVSSVYHNRLANNMRLQADPTVVYALGERRRLYNRDYRVDSPYNTYRVSGLPPHPINQPSRESIEAALYPSESDFYFFVAGDDGKHVFSRSYREHLSTIREIRGEGR